jgi:hypothetical protein
MGLRRNNLGPVSKENKATTRMTEAAEFIQSLAAVPQIIVTTESSGTPELTPEPETPEPPPPLTELTMSEVLPFTDVVNEMASYDDWWDRAISAVLHQVDPDHMLRFWGNPWLHEGAELIVNIHMSWAGPRQRPHIVAPMPWEVRKFTADPTAIERLDNHVCHPQGTPGWFMDRYTLISASTAWKAITSEASLRALIREKLVMPQPGMKDPAANPSSPLHWGKRYEPISTALYSLWFDVEVNEYGCIRHPDYPFLGASPDGVVSTFGPYYGRMLEIKNVVNRELTGIPKREYWIQMQLQMEACNLPLCDFLECQFVEYPTWNEAKADGTFDRTADGKPKGALLMLFDTVSQRIRYFYPPLAITELADYESWEKETRAANPQMEWMQRIWWRLENYSLVTVERHRGWFNSVLWRFEHAWNEILAARAAAETEAAAFPPAINIAGGHRGAMPPVQQEEGIVSADGAAASGAASASAVASGSKSIRTNVDPDDVYGEYDVPTYARDQTQWPAGGCLIRQDPEEDDDAGKGPGA